MHRFLARTLLIAAGPLAAPLALAQTDFRACLAELRGQAQTKGVSAATFDKATQGLEPDSSVIEAFGNQPELKTPIWDYLAGLVDDERIVDGRAKLKEWESTLAAAEQRFGVDRHTLVAVWGVESDYGKSMGSRPLVRSLATLSCNGARQNYFRGEFFATLQIVQSGDIKPELLVGSWAGAFGQTQFMPSTFQRIAIDFDGDGKRDIVDSIPDVIGSTANYLRRAGWLSGAPWGYEVRVPNGFDGASGRRHKQPLSHWSALGIERIGGGTLGGKGDAALLLPAGVKGPAFLVFKNFDAIFAYNAAESYALAIAHLADRLRGGAPFATPWPTDDRGLSRAERRDVQRLLNERGYDVGAPDGRIGPKTQAALKEFQAKIGLPANGRAGGKVLEALRREK
jgi:lytic murein transglycosylase